MDKQEKVNKVKFWLQRHGERNEQGFTHDIIFNDFHDENIVYGLTLDYNYGIEGEEYDEVAYCRKHYKHLRNNTIKDLSDEELDEIIEVLFS